MQRITRLHYCNKTDVSCSGIISIPPNSVMDTPPSPSFSVGSTITFHCSALFKYFDGLITKKIKCQNSGQWTTSPECISMLSNNINII